MNAISSTLARDFSSGAAMPSRRLWRAYCTEARFETIRALRAPAFSIPFLMLPIALYVLIGVFLVNAMSHGDARIAPTMFANWSVFGVMGPGMFGFGMFVALEREQGLLRLKRAMPMPPAAYLAAKMAMTAIFSGLVMLTLIAGAVALAPMTLTAGQYIRISLLELAGSLPFCAIGLFIGSLASGKAAPAFVNLAYIPMMHLGGLFYPLPKAAQVVEFFTPAFYLDKLSLRLLGAPSMDELAFGGSAPSSHVSSAVCVAVLAGITLLFGMLAARRLKRVG